MKNKLILAGMILMMALFGGCTDKDKTHPDNPDTDVFTDVGLKFSKESGVYADEFSLEISVDEGFDIFYTTDGSDPADSSTAILYDGAISVKKRTDDANVVSAVSPSLFCTNFCNYSEKDGITCYIQAPSDDNVDKCTVIRAVAKDNAGDTVQTAGATYFIGTAEEHIEGIKESCDAAGKNLAVISITMNYDDLFDYDKGIYVKGASFDESFEQFKLENRWFKAEDTRKLLANYSQRGREWEREAHIEVFEMNADSCSEVISQDCGIRIQGNYSRSDLQKGFRLYARSDYGQSKFDYPLFGEDLKNEEGNVIDEFDTFVLRAGGNCAFTSKYNDTFWQTLSGDMDISTKASRPCVVYLNGEYWGLYVLEEDYSDDYFEDHYGVNKDDVVVYKGDAETYEIGYKLDEGEIPEGENVTYYYKDLLDFFAAHENLENEADYEEFKKLVDPQSVMDYFAVEVWINNKWDWPGKNWSMWKSINPDSDNEYNDGRWRFCLYDVEFGGISGSNDAYTNTIKEDNYKPKGLLDFDTDNPAVLCFAYLMTNQEFRTEYCDRLSSLSEDIFNKEEALAKLEEFENVYGPLFPQFFDRYPETGSKENALYGGYGSSKFIRDFLEKRGDNIQNIISWVERQFK